MKTVIKNGTVITAGDTIKADVLIEGEKITLIGKDLPTEGCEVIDAAGKYVIPGGIDAHTHLDMPFGGTTTADDFFTGQRAAAFGGTTCHVDFALQQQGDTMVNGIKMWKAKAEGKAVIDYGFHVAITVPTMESVNEIPKLWDEGVSSLKVFQQYKGAFMVDDTTMYLAMQKAAESGILIMCHCENGDVTDIVTKQRIAEGKIEPKYHLDAHPAAIEAEASARAIALAEVTGANLYIVHMSCEESVEQLRIGRKRGAPVMGETCTQYMFKFEDDMRVPGYEGAKWACGPPVRKPKDAAYLWESLKDTTLLGVATDHCSFNYEGGKDGGKPGKELGKEGFHKIPNGIPGIEDRMYVMYHNGVNSGKISVNRFVDITSTGPAKALGLYPKKGTISVGSDADIVIWDPEKEMTISAKTHHMNVDYNAYEGMKVKGFPVRTILRGKTIVENGEWKQEKGAGQFVARGKAQLL
ncbi:MAG: dihydropyrimidinase [Spirochaetales bacterium]|nr:dihydropyrimidinase [Spirochaetales bacterium]